MNYYSSLNSTKKEVALFVEMLNLSTNLVTTEENENNCRFISKNILFLKELFEYKKVKTHLDVLIYSAFQALYNSVIINGAVEIFNLYKRIYIENLFRYLLSVQNNKESIRAMRERLKGESNEEEKEILDYFYDEHKKASGVLHVNNWGDINISEYFQEINEMNLCCSQGVKTQNIREISQLLDKSTSLLIMKRTHLIGEVFYNKMEVLQYLIGHKKFSKYKSLLFSY